MVAMDAIAPDGSLVACWVQVSGAVAFISLVDGGRVFVFTIDGDYVRSLLLAGGVLYL